MQLIDFISSKIIINVTIDIIFLSSSSFHRILNSLNVFDLTGHATKHDRLKRALSFIRFGSYYAVLASVIERKKKKIKVLCYFCSF